MTLWQYLTENEPQPAAGGEQADLLRRVVLLAEGEQRTPDEVLFSLLGQALEIQHNTDRAHQHWESLSPREKQVAALACAGLTGRQIAARLVISPETVKTHMRHILRKFGIASRRELREQLDGWDLRAWAAGGGY
jgi:DNA-binding NarL/FixJ family response regulator